MEVRLSTAMSIARACVIEQWERNHAKHESELHIPFFVGNPGNGKTSAAHQLANELDAVFITQRLADRNFDEVAGWRIPADDQTSMVHIAPEWFKFEADKKYVIFFDELPQAPVANMNIAAAIINERVLGSYVLPPNVAFMAAGNPPSARAGTNTIPSHLNERLARLDIVSDVEDVCGYFSANGYDPLIVGYLRARPDNLHKFDPKEKGSSPRSWGKVNTALKYEVSPAELQTLIMSCVGDGVGADFLAYRKLQEKAPTIDEIINDPSTTDIPDESDVKYALCAGLSAALSTKNINPIKEYLDRLPEKEMVAFVLKDAIARDPALKQTKAVREWALNGGVQLFK